MSAVDKLFPPARLSDRDPGIFHHKKGRVARLPGDSHEKMPPPQGMSSRSKAEGVASGRSEALIKFDKARNGIKTAGHMHEAANYIARNGKLELEDEHGNVLTKDELDRMIDEWCVDQQVPGIGEPYGKQHRERSKSAAEHDGEAVVRYSELDLPRPKIEPAHRSIANEPEYQTLSELKPEYLGDIKTIGDLENERRYRNHNRAGEKDRRREDGQHQVPGVSERGLDGGRVGEGQASADVPVHRHQGDDLGREGAENDHGLQPVGATGAVGVDSKRPADARRCIVSCPKGTSPEAVRMAARELGREFFGDNGFRYVFTVHFKDEDHPKEPDHPHAHFLIKTVNEAGERLNIRKGDLKLMRERFCEIAKKYDIELNATSRAVRGQTQKGKTLERVHQERRDKVRSEQLKDIIAKRKREERSEQSQAQKWAIERKKKELEAKRHPYDRQRRREVADAVTNGKDIPDTKELKKAKATRGKVQQNAAEYIRELRATGKSEDVALAAKLEKKMRGMKPVRSAQQVLLDSARERLKARAQEKEVKRKEQEAEIGI